MTKRQVWRYKCDFCKKGNLSKYHMAKHEAACTANPNRVCNMCRFCEGSAPLVDLIAILHASGYNPENENEYGLIVKAETDKLDAQLVSLRESAGGCTACMLAAIRQSGYCGLIDFNFKKETIAFWEEVRENEPPSAYYGY